MTQPRAKRRLRQRPSAQIQQQDRPKDFKGSLLRLLHYLLPYRGWVVTVLLLAVAGTLCAVVAPRIIGQVTTTLFNSIVTDHGLDLSALGRTLVLLGGLYVVSSGMNFLQGYTMTGISQRVVYDMRRQIDEKLGRLPLRYVDGTATGDILSRVTNDADNIASSIQQHLTQLVTSLVTIVGVLAMMLYVSPLMTLIILATLPILAVTTMVVVKRSQRYFTRMWRTVGDLNGNIEEIYTGHKVVKAFSCEEAALEDFDAINDQLTEVTVKAMFVSGITQPIMNAVSNLTLVALLAVGGYRVLTGQIAVGDIQTMIMYANQFAQPISQFTGLLSGLQSTIASAERIFGLLDEEEEPQDVADGRRSPGRGQVTFRQVHFQYDPEQPLIEDLSLEVQPGKTVAIVGPTGAGKTTLVNLLMRFYDVQRGSIQVDGQDIRQMSRRDLRAHFGMVLQDTWLFEGAVRDNIAYGRPDATLEEVVRAARAARVDHFIRTLPQGYDTILTESAENISQGQRQLMTIARAFLADPAILILDEATSSVDTRTEVLLQRAMADLKQGRTSFIIAHRLSTIRDADVIVVMNHGAVVEQGTHEQLLAAQGFYAELYNSQFAGDVA